MKQNHVERERAGIYNTSNIGITVMLLYLITRAVILLHHKYSPGYNNIRFSQLFAATDMAQLH